MNTFKTLTIDGKMQTAPADKPIDLVPQRQALRAMLRGDVAFHDDPQADCRDQAEAQLASSAAGGPAGASDASTVAAAQEQSQEAAKPQLVEGAVYRWSSGVTVSRYKVVGNDVFVRRVDGGFDKICLIDREEIADSVARGQLIPDTPQPDAEGWIAHTPGPCPVAGDVRVQYRSGVETVCSGVWPAFAMRWEERGRGTITHYRIVSAA